MSPTGRPPRPRTEYHVSITSVPPRAALPRGVLVLVGLAATVIVIAGMRASADIFAPAFLALVLTVLAHPLRRWLDRWMPSWAASLVCTVGDLPARRRSGSWPSWCRWLGSRPCCRSTPTSSSERVDDLTSWLNNAGVSTKQIDNVKSSFDLGQLSGFIGDLLGGADGPGLEPLLHPRAGAVHDDGRRLVPASARAGPRRSARSSWTRSRSSPAAPDATSRWPRCSA